MVVGWFAGFGVRVYGQVGLEFAGFIGAVGWLVGCSVRRRCHSLSPSLLLPRGFDSAILLHGLAESERKKAIKANPTRHSRSFFEV